MLVFSPDRIIALRVAKGMKANKFAEELGVPPAQVHHWEHRKRTPTIQSLLLICNTFDVDPSFFFTKSNYHGDERRANAA